MGGNNFNSDEGKKMNTGDENKNDETTTPATETPSTPSQEPASGDTPATAPSTEESAVETGDATQGGEPAASADEKPSDVPADAPADPAPAPVADPTPGTDAPAPVADPAPAPGAAEPATATDQIVVRVTGAVKGEKTVDGKTTVGDVLKAMGHTPSNFTLRDEATSKVIELTDPISSLTQGGVTISAAAKGKSAQTTSASAGMTSTSKARGG